MTVQRLWLANVSFEIETKGPAYRGFCCLSDFLSGSIWCGCHPPASKIASELILYGAEQWAASGTLLKRWKARTLSRTAAISYRWKARAQVCTNYRLGTCEIWNYPLSYWYQQCGAGNDISCCHTTNLNIIRGGHKFTVYLCHSSLHRCCSASRPWCRKV